MKLELVGFEGRMQDSSLISWGAAAIREGEELVNGVTGMRSPIAKLAKFVERGAIQPLSPVEIPRAFLGGWVIGIRRGNSADLPGLFRDRRSPSDRLDFVDLENQMDIILLRDWETCEKVRKSAMQELVSRVTALVSVGFVVDAHSLHTNAWNTVLHAGDPIWKMMGYAGLRNEEDKSSYNALFSGPSLERKEWFRCFACGRFTSEVTTGGPSVEEAGQSHRWETQVLDVHSPQSECGAAVACWECFWKTDPDMWITPDRWDALSPLIPAADLPSFNHENSDPSAYPWPSHIKPRVRP